MLGTSKEWLAYQKWQECHTLKSQVATERQECNATIYISLFSNDNLSVHSHKYKHTLHGPPEKVLKCFRLQYTSICACHFHVQEVITVYRLLYHSDLFQPYMF